MMMMMSANCLVLCLVPPQNSLDLITALTFIFITQADIDIIGIGDIHVNTCPCFCLFTL